MKVQLIDRIFDILELLSTAHEGLSLTEISQELELHPSTVFRTLSALQERNYINKNDFNNKYRLGLGFVELTSLSLNNLELKTEAQTVLRNLCQMTGQVVFMGIEQDGELVYIDKHEYYKEIRDYCFIGQRHQLYCTALGKSLLTGFRDDDIRRLYQSKEMVSYTPNTITDIDELLRDIHATRSRGYSIDDEENTVGIYCVASPVYDYRKVVIAAISTSWDLNLHKDADREGNIELVKKTAESISLRMGYRPEDMKVSNEIL